MAQFRGTLKGNRGQASRLGSKQSGLSVTANGWNDGVRIEVQHIDGQDHFFVWRTGGSNGGGGKLVARWIEGERTQTAVELH